MPKLDLVSIRKEPNEYFNDEHNRQTIAEMDGEKQKNFITNLVAEASPKELGAIAKSATQVLGGFEGLHGFRDMVGRAVVAKQDISNMMECGHLAKYLLGKEQVDDVDFNADLYREFDNLFVMSLSEEEQIQFMDSAIASCENGKEMSDVAKLIGNTFSPAQGELLQELIALKYTQNLATSDNPAVVLLDRYFNPDLIRGYWKQFCAEMDGKVDAVAEKICQADLSLKDLSKVGRILEQMNPDAADKKNPVSQLQAAVNEHMASKDNSGKIAAEIGFLGNSQQQMRRRNVAPTPHSSPERKDDEVVQSASCFPGCNIL